VLLFATLAWAGDDLDAAREHYQKGKRAYDIGHFAEAASEYELAYTAKDDPALLFNLGQAHRLAGNRAEAIIAYRAYLRNAPDAPNRAEVEQLIHNLQATPNGAPTGAPVTAPPPPSPLPSQSLSPPPPSSPSLPPPPPSPVAAPVIVRRPPSRLVHRPWLWLTVAGGVALVATGVAVGVVYGSSTRYPAPTSGSVPGN
jgi:tetratricopeptide (TPR) repeat protein